MTNEMTVNDMKPIAIAIAKSGLFGIKTPEQALALMAIAQAEGLHPAAAARDYHIIQGRPSLRADAMLARFLASNGKVEWKEYSDERCTAIFSHPQGGTVEISWDMKRAKQADLGGRDIWRKYPRQMLRARVISEGIRTVYPGVVSGFYTPEEVQDFDAPPPAKAANSANYETPVYETSYEKIEEADEIIEAAEEAFGEVTVIEKAKGPKKASEKQLKFIMSLAKQQNLQTKEEMLQRFSDILGRNVEGREDLTIQDAKVIIDNLQL